MPLEMGLSGTILARMKPVNEDPEDDLARLSQEATNQSTPDKSLTDSKAKKAEKMKVPPHRSKAPKGD